MLIIKHRIDTLKKVTNTNTKFGIEFDVRSHNKKITIGHDPFNSKKLLDRHMRTLKNRFIVFDVKEEGIEDKIIQVIKKYKIKNYFLLNVTFPRINYFLKRRKKIDFSLRMSAFEDIKDLNFFYRKIKWIWVDTFNNQIPIKLKEIKKISKKFKLCLVSPEIVPVNLGTTKNFIKKNKEKLKYFSAVCTKKTNLWEDLNDNNL